MIRFLINALTALAFIIGYMAFIESLEPTTSWAIFAGLVLWKLYDVFDYLFAKAWPKRSTYDTP